jgi:hypothetical protein
MKRSPGDNGAAGLDQTAAILAECRAQRTRARLWAVVSGIFVAALIVATVLAATEGHYRGLAAVLIPVLLVINLLRLAQSLVALGKIGKAERLVRDAQAQMRSGDWLADNK